MSFADKIRAAITRRLETADDRALKEEQWEADMRADGWTKVPDQAEKYVGETAWAEEHGLTVEEARSHIEDELADVENPEAAFERWMEAAEAGDHSDDNAELQADIREAIEEGLLVGRSATKITQDVMAEVRFHRSRQVEDDAEVTTAGTVMTAEEVAEDMRRRIASAEGEAEAVRQFEEQDARRREVVMRYFDNREAELAAEAEAAQERAIDQGEAAVEEVLDAEDRDVSNPRNALDQDEADLTREYVEAHGYDEETAKALAAIERSEAEAVDLDAIREADRQEVERQAPKARRRPSVDTGSDDYYYGSNTPGHGFAF